MAVPGVARLIIQNRRAIRQRFDSATALRQRFDSATALRVVRSHRCCRRVAGSSCRARWLPYFSVVDVGEYTQKAVSNFDFVIDS